jgi:hypothetical protein
MATYFNLNGDPFLSEEFYHVSPIFSNPVYNAGAPPLPPPPIPQQQPRYHEYNQHEGYTNYNYGGYMVGNYQYGSVHFHSPPTEHGFAPHVGLSDSEQNPEYYTPRHYAEPSHGPYAVYYDPAVFTPAVGIAHVDRRHPDLDNIRRQDSLINFITKIPLYRRFLSLGGPTVDIVEEITGEILCKAVPKSMLVLVFGRPEVSMHLFTVNRDDHEMNPRGYPRTQKFLVGAQETSADAWRILVAWMKRACGDPSRRNEKLMELQVPDSLFVAVKLACTLRYMGLCIDADRIDSAIINNHLKRPLHLASVKAIWKSVPKDSKYTWRIIEVLKEQYSLPIVQARELLPDHTEMTEWLHGNPELRARMWQPGLNDVFKPMAV